MAATDQDWARAYARQALSDLDVRDELAIASAHKCHRLHFLQMAAEKICKAHLTSANGHENVRKTHAYIEKNLPIIARLFYGRANDANPMAQWEMQQIKRIAKENRFWRQHAMMKARDQIIANTPGKTHMATFELRVSTVSLTSMTKVGPSFG